MLEFDLLSLIHYDQELIEEFLEQEESHEYLIRSVMLHHPDEPCDVMVYMEFTLAMFFAHTIKPATSSFGYNVPDPKTEYCIEFIVTTDSVNLFSKKLYDIIRNFTSENLFENIDYITEAECYVQDMFEGEREIEWMGLYEVAKKHFNL